MENATVVKNLVPVVYSEKNGYHWLTIDIPNGWDDVKTICKKVLNYQGRNFVFTGWNSDTYKCFFRASESLAKIS